MSLMAAIFSGLASMPRSETMNPNSIPFGTPKHALLRVELYAVFPQFCECQFEVVDERARLLGFNNDVIHVDLDDRTH